MPESPTTRKRKFPMVTGAGAVAFVLLLIPGNYIAAPAWDVLLLEAKDRPAPNVQVEQIWSYYFGAFSEEHNELIKSDENGVVHLPKRIVRVPRLFAWAGSAIGILNVHASRGPSSTVYVSEDGYGRNSIPVGQVTPASNGVRRSIIVIGKRSGLQKQTSVASATNSP